MVFADRYLTPPILPLLSREFGVAAATAGLPVSVVVLLIALASYYIVGTLVALWGVILGM